MFAPGPTPIKKFSRTQRLLAPGFAVVFALLVFFALYTYRRSAELLTQEHNFQHQRLIEIVAMALKNHLADTQAAFKYHATLIPPTFPVDKAREICARIEQSYPDLVSQALILQPGHREEFWTSKLYSLALTSDSLTKLERALTKSEPTLLLLLSAQSGSSLLFLTPIPNSAARLAVIVPFEKLMDTYQLNPSDDKAEGDYVWILDRDGTLLYHRRHPEMVGRSIYRADSRCTQCHQSFEIEQEMVQGTVGSGWNEVPPGSRKIIAYAPLDFADRHWVMAISEPIGAITASAQWSLRDYTVNAIILSLIVFGTAIYITRLRYLRHQAEQETLHLRQERLLQQQLERKQRQLLEAERFATLGRMAAQVAHEIKNPLSSISLNTELLSDELQTPGKQPAPEALQLIESILAEIDLLTATIDEYLQFARFPKLQKELTSLEEIWGGLRQLLQEESSSRAIDLVFYVHPSLTPFLVDARLLRQALLNLIRNSFDAIETKGWVRLHAVRQNGDLRIEVSDSGPGVSLQNRPLLFQPFFTTKPRGTGLGLSLTRHIIFEHGGSINYEPTPEAVSRFVITMPFEEKI
ncbi:MAG: hypothetical protein HY645_01275 [Acidobacteria bacterium]|nr:hypothetical protein [Acidobacteriota bacterium]